MAELKLPTWYVGEEYLGDDNASDHSCGLAVFSIAPGQPDDEIGEVVCRLYDHMGSHFETFDNAERNARVLAAAPAMLGALMKVLRTFDRNSRKVSAEFQEAIGTAHAAVRLTLSEEEQSAEIESFVATLEGRLQ